jgi:hypothetical protein
VDTVFICRSTGTIPERLLATSSADVAVLVAEELDLLREAGVSVTRGDARCITYGHLVRLAIWRLRKGWDQEGRWGEKLAEVGEAISRLPRWEEILPFLEQEASLVSRRADLVCEQRDEELEAIEPTIHF